MKFKKVVALATTAILSTSLLVGCSGSKSDSADKKKDVTIAMVTDTGGVNDLSFNQSAWEGLQKAEKELGVKVKYLESHKDSDYMSNIETLVDEEVDLIVGVGFKIAPAIEDSAKLFPKQKFAIVDATYDKVPENVKSILFNDPESSYLVGAIAAKMTKTNNVGFIGGVEIPSVQTFEYGYLKGVEDTNPEVKVQRQYANSFTDSAKGKAIAQQMHKKGADIIFAAAGGVGTGAIEAARENNKYAIGVDRDQSNEAPDNMLTSAMKRVDVGVFETVKELVEDKFPGGTSKVYGLEEGGIGIPDTTSKLVPKDVLDYVKELEGKLKKGEIKVPGTPEEYKEMSK